MLKLLKVIFAAVVAAAMIFTSCENGGGFDYVDESGSSPVLKMEGLTASDSEDYDYVLNKEGIMPGEGDGSFTVFVKNAKPAKVFVKSGVEGITFKAGALTATEESDSVGKGGWKSVVSYSVSSDMTDAVDGNVSVIVMFSDSSVEDMTVRVNAKVSIMQESDNYAVIDPVQGEKAEHSLSVSWSYKTGYEPVTVSYEIYKVAEDAEADGGYSYTKVEEGTLDAEFSSLTSKTPLTGKSDYCVKVKVIGKSGWYVSTIGDAENGWITTSDDITPPAVPAVEFGTAKEDSFTVIYTKGEDTDDTMGLVVSVKDSNGSAVSEYTVSAVDESDASYVYDTEDANKVTLKNSREETGTVSVKGFDVSGLAHGKSLTITVGGLVRAKTDTAYTVSVTAYDGCYNHVTGNAVSANTAGDTKAPVVASSTVKVNSGLTSAKITWENPSDSDFESVTVKKGDEVVKENITDGTFVATGLTEDVTYTLYAVDSIGNVQAAGIEAKVELDEISVNAARKYTGSVLVTWNDVTDYGTDGSEVSYTYDASCSPAEVSALTGIAAGKGEAHFTGLTAGTDYTFTVAVKKDGASVVSKTTGVVTAKVVIWRIVNTFEADADTANAGVVPYITASKKLQYVHSCDWNDMGMLFRRWIVRPSLSDAEDSLKFSLEVSTETAQTTGAYMTLDSEKVNSWVNDYITKGWWGDGYSFKNSPHFYPVLKSEITNTSNASYKLLDSNYSNTVPTGYDGWKCIQVGDSYYVVDKNLILSGGTEYTPDDKDNCFAIKEELLDSFGTSLETIDAPSGVAVSEKSDTTMTLTWTNPSSSHFSHVVVSCSDDSVDAVTTSDSKLEISGLTPGTSYTFTVTSYSVFGAECEEPVTVTDSTNALLKYPTNVTATVKYTGSITVTWTDIAASGYTYKVECSDNAVAAKEDIAAGTQEAYFTGLTVGSTYTFTVTAIKGGETFSDATESKATVEVKQKKVHIMGGGSKYLQVKDSSAVAFFSTGTSNEYTWVVMPALNGDESMFSLKSAVSEKYLVVDLGTDHSSETAPFGGWTGGQNTTCALILTDKPTDDTIKNQASFKETAPANGSDGWSSFLMNGDSARYLRDWWDIANCNTAQTGDDAKFSSQKFIDVE